jgi:cellulose synthase/poly-beta-1,6-N-acetylglucosamine synthase-like glycosyltransferase
MDFYVLFILFSLIFLSQISLWLLYRTSKSPKYCTQVSKNVPLVTILIPIYGESKSVIERTLESIRNQSYKNVSIYLLDDSELSIFDVPPEGCRIIRRDNRMGFKGGALKNAIGLIKSDYIYVCDSDTIHECDALQTAVDIAENTQCGFVQLPVKFYNKYVMFGIFATFWDSLYGEKVRLAMGRRGLSQCLGSGMLIRKSVLNPPEYFYDESLVEDSGMAARLHSQNIVCLYSERPPGVYGSSNVVSWNDSNAQVVRCSYGTMQNLFVMLKSSNFTFKQNYMDILTMTWPIESLIRIMFIVSCLLFQEYIWIGLYCLTHICLKSLLSPKYISLKYILLSPILEAFFVMPGQIQGLLEWCFKVDKAFNVTKKE